MFKHDVILKYLRALGRLVVILLLLLSSKVSVSWAESSKTTNAGTASYLFVDNQVDTEYYITTLRDSPSFRGPNKWSKLSTPVSLGQMGYGGWAADLTFMDLWIDNPPVPRPFLGLYCQQSSRFCPSQGTIPGEKTDEKGFYKAFSGIGAAGGWAPIGTISPEMYEFARSAAINSKQDMRVNWCNTHWPYELSQQKCTELKDNDRTWWSYNLSILKIGHLILEDAAGVSEIWVASDGSSQLKSETEHCKNQRVSNLDGVVCKVVKYNYKSSQNPTMYVSLQLDPHVFTKFKPGEKDILFSANGSSWYNWGKEVSFGSVFSAQNAELMVFMSNSFFRDLIKKNVSLTDAYSFFSFRLRNLYLPAEEAYYFSATSSLKITPREYGLSIISSDGMARPKASGKIGSDEPPIEFNYRITLSAPKLADIVSAEVLGAQIKVLGNRYCLFESPDRTLQVPIPAELEYTHANGQRISKHSNCGAKEIDMTHAKWSAEPWSDHQGSYYSTDLKLKFPMNQPVSQLTSDGRDWMGVVTADGMVHIKAQWIGVDQ